MTWLSRLPLDIQRAQWPAAITALATVVLLTSCGGGGPRGEYTGLQGLVTYTFKTNHTVEVSTKMFGVEQTQEMQYDFEDGKITLGPKDGPRVVLTMDEHGCFSPAGAGQVMGLMDLKLCKVGSDASPQTAGSGDSARTRPAPDPEAAFVAGMKSDLRDLVTAEESYFADNTTYTTAASALRFTPSAGVTVTIGTASGTGWNATATHVSTSKTCAIYVGSAAAPIPGGNQGEPNCR